MELQGNDDTSATESYVTMEVETEVQNKKIDPEAISKTPGETTATISRAQKVKVFREAAREGLEERAKKMKATSSKKFQKPTLGQNVRIKIPNIDRAKTEPLSQTLKTKNFMNLLLSWVNLKRCTQETNLPYFLSVEEVGTEEISICEVVNKYM